MKGYIYIYITVILLALSTMSCENDFELDIPRSTKNVVLSNFTPDSLLKVYVSSTVPIGTADSVSLTYPHEARVSLSIEGSYVGDLMYNERKQGELSYYVSTSRVKAGLEYEVEVEVDQKPISKAKNRVPRNLTNVNATLISLEEVPDANFSDLVNVTARVRIDISDDSDIGFYYHIIGAAYGEALTSLDVVSDVDYLPIYHEEGVLVRLSKDNSSAKYFELEVSFFYYSDFESREPFSLDIRKCSKDYYLFHRSVGEQELSNYRDGILSSQSIQIHNNIEDGVGNFSSYNNHVRQVEW